VGAAAGAKDPLLGDVLVVLAQLLAATQFIVEEKYLAKCGAAAPHVSYSSVQLRRRTHHSGGAWEDNA
jgi:hypothetical protein